MKRQQMVWMPVLMCAAAGTLVMDTSWSSEDSEGGWGTTCAQLDLTGDGLLDDQDIVAAYIQSAVEGTEYIVALGVGGFLSFPHACSPAQDEFLSFLEEGSEADVWSEEDQSRVDQYLSGDFSLDPASPVCFEGGPTPCAVPDVVYLDAASLTDLEVEINIVDNDLVGGGEVEVVFDPTFQTPGVEFEARGLKSWIYFSPTDDTEYTTTFPKSVVVPYTLRDPETGHESPSAVLFVVDERGPEIADLMAPPPNDEPWPEWFTSGQTEEAIRKDIQYHLPNGDGEYQGQSDWSYVCCEAQLHRGTAHPLSGGYLTLSCHDNLTDTRVVHKVYMAGGGTGVGVSSDSLYLCTTRMPRAGDLVRFAGFSMGKGIGFDIATLEIFDGHGKELGSTMDMGFSLTSIEEFGADGCGLGGLIGD